VVVTGIEGIGNGGTGTRLRLTKRDTGVDSKDEMKHTKGTVIFNEDDVDG